MNLFCDEWVWSERAGVLIEWNICACKICGVKGTKEMLVNYIVVM